MIFVCVKITCLFNDIRIFMIMEIFQQMCTLPKIIILMEKPFLIENLHFLLVINNIFKLLILYCTITLQHMYIPMLKNEVESTIF